VYGLSSAGRKRYEPSEPGSNPGSCSDASGKRGQHCPHLTLSSNFLSPASGVPALSLCHLLTLVHKLAVIWIYHFFLMYLRYEA
jgi:hypothetical protein